MKQTTTTIRIPAGPVVERREAVPSERVHLTDDMVVEATRMPDGCWGYRIPGDAAVYLCADAAGERLTLPDPAPDAL